VNQSTLKMNELETAVQSIDRKLEAYDLTAQELKQSVTALTDEVRLLRISVESWRDSSYQSDDTDHVTVRKEARPAPINDIDNTAEINHEQSIVVVTVPVSLVRSLGTFERMMESRVPLMTVHSSKMLLEMLQHCANHHLDTYSAAYNSIKFVQDRMKDASISYKKRMKLLLEFAYKFRSRADIEVFRRSVSSDINDNRFLEHLLDSKLAVVNSSVLSAVSNLERERNKNRNIQNRRMKMAPAKNPTASILSHRIELLVVQKYIDMRMTLENGLLTVPIDHAE